MSLKVLFRVPLRVWHGVQGSGKGTFRQLREICPDSKIGRLFQCLASPPYAFSSECIPRKTLGLRNIKAPIFGSRKPKSGLPPIFWLKSRELRLLGV